MRKPSGSRAQQHGAATLLVSMVLLIAATLLVLYASNTVVGEQRMSANDVRSKQAFEAAQAAVELTIKHMNDEDADNDFQVASLNSLNSSWEPSNSTYRVSFCEPASFDPDDLPQCSDDAAAGIVPASCSTPAAGVKVAWAVSCGWSDDSAARKRIITFITKTEPLPGDIKNPLTAKGAVEVKGNSTVVNYYNNLTVWSGGDLNPSGSNPGKTAIRRPSSAQGMLTPDEVDAQVGDGATVCNNAADLICTTTGGVNGPDVIKNDNSLERLTDDEFFANFLGLPPAEYKNLMAEEIVAGSDAGSISAGGKVYWVDGNATINRDIGTRDKPVVLVVNGNLTFSGTPTIFGVVVVKGNLESGGGARIRGAVVVTGDVPVAAGTLNIIYDPDAIAGAGEETGKYTNAPGTWRDF